MISVGQSSKCDCMLAINLCRSSSLSCWHPQVPWPSILQHQQPSHCTRPDAACLWSGFSPGLFCGVCLCEPPLPSPYVPTTPHIALRGRVTPGRCCARLGSVLTGTRCTQEQAPMAGTPAAAPALKRGSKQPTVVCLVDLDDTLIDGAVTLERSALPHRLRLVLTVVLAGAFLLQ